MKIESQCFKTAQLGELDQSRIKWHGYKEFFDANFDPEKSNVGILYQNKKYRHYMITHTKLQTKFYDQEHFSLKVPNIEFNFDVSVDSVQW